jgi:hypothetical protein
MIEKIKASEAVENVSKELKGKIFINLIGQQRHMKGDSSSKIWLDVDAEKIYWKMGKGTCSSSFNESLEKFKEEFEITRQY